jgi:hypothetical protein
MLQSDPPSSDSSRDQQAEYDPARGETNLMLVASHADARPGDQRYKP